MCPLTDYPLRLCNSVEVLFAESEDEDEEDDMEGFLLIEGNFNLKAHLEMEHSSPPLEEILPPLEEILPPLEEILPPLEKISPPVGHNYKLFSVNSVALLFAVISHVVVAGCYLFGK